MPCKNCGSTSTVIGKVPWGDGDYHIAEWCQSCDQNARGGGQWIGKRTIKNPDDLPVVQQYSPPGVCYVCGAPAFQVHHYAPKHIFGDRANLYPTGYLCKEHHNEWHELIAAHDAGQCIACKGRTTKAKQNGR